MRRPPLRLACLLALLPCTPAAAAVHVVDRADEARSVALAPGLVLFGVPGEKELAPGELRAIPLTPGGARRGPVQVLGAAPEDLDMIPDARGGYLAAWDAFRRAHNVSVQRLDAGGAPSGSRAELAGLRHPALVAVGARGDALLAAVRPNGAIGLHKLPAEVATTEMPPDLAPQGTHPAVAADEAGERVLVAWVTDGGDDAPNQIHAVVTDASGRPAGPARQISLAVQPDRGDNRDDPLPGGAGAPAVARVDGGWIVAWQELEATGTISHIDGATYTGTYRMHVRRLDDAGAPVGGVGLGSAATTDLRDEGEPAAVTAQNAGEVLAAATTGPMLAARVDAATGGVRGSFALARHSRVGDVIAGPGAARVLTAFAAATPAGVELRTRLSGPEPPDVSPPRVTPARATFRGTRRTVRLTLRCDEACTISGVAGTRAFDPRGRPRALAGRRGARIALRRRAGARGCGSLYFDVIDRDRNRAVRSVRVCAR